MAAGCGRCDRGDAPSKPPADAAAPRLDGGVARLDGGATTADLPVPDWPELAELPVLTPRYTAVLRGGHDVPRFDLGGPALAGRIAVVASSSVGFVAVDLPSGTPAWTRSAGLHVAPPITRGDRAILVGDCADPIASAPGDLLLGCLEIVDARRGATIQSAIVRGARDAAAAFAATPGPQRISEAGPGGALWQRGRGDDARAVRIDIASGRAEPAPVVPERVELAYKGDVWRWAVEDEALVARDHEGRQRWRLGRRMAAVVGAFAATPPEVPVVRAVIAGVRDGRGAFTIVDVEGLTGEQGTAAQSIPGIQILASAFGPHGVTALVVRLDTSLTRDYVATFDGNGLLLWVYPLPEAPRGDPVGVAVDDERVVVFHDGDRLAVLPLSGNPTAPSAPPAPSRNPTP